jgi:signal transduction histidine kinase
MALVGSWLGVALVHFLVPAQVRLFTWPLGYILLEALACACLVHRARAGKGRAAWWLLAGSTFLDVMGIGLTYMVIHGYAPGTAAAPIYLLSLGTGVLVLAGILSFPQGPERRGVGFRRILDSLIFASSLLFLLWVMGMQGSLNQAPQGMGVRVFVAYLNAALLGGGVIYITSSRPGRGPFGWLALSALAWLVALSCWTLAGLPSMVMTQKWIVLAGLIPLFQGLAALSDDPVDDPLDGSPWRVAKFFPFLPMTVGIGVLAWLLVWRPADVTRTTFAIFLVMVVFLLLRMLQAIKDLQAARATLEDRVAQRTQALEKAQQTLLRTERMNTMATLGAGQAHDLNNLLGVIRNSAEALRANLEIGRAPSGRELGRIIEAAGKAGHFTERLLAFGKREEGADRTREITEAVGACRELLSMLLPRGYRLQLQVDACTCGVKVDTGTLEQVLVNLVSNAKDAMPGGGEVTISVRCGFGPQGEPAAILDVRDSGTGIPPALLDRIFEPFFTTKPEGSGTGLGLASVRALMEAQGGTVEVVASSGEGTTFRLVFPGR